MDRIPKYRIPVRISFGQEAAVLGVVFIRQEQRILDMLCDAKPFFPISTKHGMLLINKTAVVKVEVLEMDFVVQNKDNFSDQDVLHDFEAHAELSRRRNGNLETA